MADDLSLPRILCLHGGGTSAEVFEIQCRIIIRQLQNRCRLVFVNGPWTSHAHPAILPYFADLGPFYRWLRWNDDDPFDPQGEEKILAAIEKAMKEDPGRGDFVGVLGFSQGAKIAGSLLWAQEKSPKPRTSFKFGVILAGRAPYVVLDPEKQLPAVAHVADIGQQSIDFKDWAPTNEGEHVLSLPTLHVHGLKDPGLEEHRVLLKNYCKTGTTRLIEWDGDHRVPIQADIVTKLVGYITEMAHEAGLDI
ncbi:unnamed protein product [Clonostachys rosea f. rosea IK726]|jgi:predicted esterase|uniref:Serine hydrolase domain-containing protein n=2 Tax=Bionectria ochroleuca TaxID=29856 RepID=A0A8H7N0V9_BIOOC|nr:unnamed protein product [Clonostachys rosea f. rosea IK726]